MSSSENADRTSGLVAGAIGGVVAYVLGYLTVYVTQGNRIEEGFAGINFLADLFGNDPISTWQAAGWMFYNAHFVDTTSPGLFGGARSVSLIAEAEGGALTVLYVIPPLLLIAVGVAAARVAGATEPADGAQSGALVVAGYLPLAVLGAFLFRYSVGDGVVAPDLITAVLLAGVVYPVAFGAIGGIAATFLND